MIERVTTFFELLGVAFLTAAVGLATDQRFGLVWALVAVSLVFFGWSVLFELVSRRPRAET